MNIFGRIARYFLENKQLSVLILIGIILWGMISFAVMPKQYNPDIVAPAFLISAEFPGATVDEVYQIVSKPLEDVLNELPGVENIYSRSIHGGRTETIVEFFVGEDMHSSMIQLRQKISSRLNLSPLGVSDPYIATIDPEDLPIMTLAFYSDTLDAVALRKRAFALRDRLKTIPGLSLVEVMGGRIREFQILLDPEKMKQTKTSLSEIGQALEGTSVLNDMGSIKAGEDYYRIETQEQVITTADIEEIIIVSNVDQILRVKDVARVVEGEKETDDHIGFSTKARSIDNPVYMTFAKKKGENIVNVARLIRERLAYLMAHSAYFEDLHCDIVKDEGRVAREQINGLVINLLQAIAIVFVVLLFFLNHRAALIVAISIPITLLVVFAVGNLFGYTINRITLFALILSLGLLVDSATVVIENIVKNKRRFPDMPKNELIPRSVSEVGVGLLLSTVTTVLAFIPMLFVTGMMGPYMGPLPFFVSTALIVALVFAYTLNPWFASVLCKDTLETVSAAHCGLVCRLLKAGRETYRNTLDGLLLNRVKRRFFLATSFLLLLIVLSFPVARLLRFRMLPKADREQMFVYIDLDRGTSFERAEREAKRFVDALVSQKNITSIQSFVGTPPVLDFNGLFRGVSARRGTHQITLKLNLTHPDERSKSSEELARSYREIVYAQAQEVPEARIAIVEDPPGPPVRATFYVKVKSEDPVLLRQVTYDLEEKVRHIREVKDVDVSLLEDHTKYVLSVDKVAAAHSKISVKTITQELETIFAGRMIGVYHSDYNYEQEYIVLKFSRDLRDSIDDLDSVYIVNAVGNHVPVSRFVRVKEMAQEDEIRGDNRRRVAYISAEMGQRSVTYAAIDLLKILYSYSVPGHVSERTGISLLQADYMVDQKDPLRIEIGGEWDLTVKVFRDLGAAMLVAIIMIYLVLVAQFKSFLLPLMIMVTIPLALVGVFPGFWLLFVFGRIYFSATSMIGVIALAGIVVNNAILFIEYAMQSVAQHPDLRETLLDAGLTRMRPILLTSITTVLGSLVIAMDPVWSGLAWAIVFGLSLSAILTLIVIPVLIYEFLGEKWFEKIKIDVNTEGEDR
jgi:multidrug efflux pump subunit AcrB